MSGISKEDFVLAAIAYAAKRWVLDDPTLIREYCETRRAPDDTPESLMDDLARRYDLIDPALIPRKWTIA